VGAGRPGSLGAGESLCWGRRSRDRPRGMTSRSRCTRIWCVLPVRMRISREEQPEALKPFHLAHRLSRRPCPLEIRAVKDVAADGAIDREPLGGRPRERQIDLRDRSLLELSLRDRWARSFFATTITPRSSGVEPMDDPRPHHAPIRSDRWCGRQGVHESAGGVARRRMNHHARLLFTTTMPVLVRMSRGWLGTGVAGAGADFDLDAPPRQIRDARTGLPSTVTRPPSIQRFASAAHVRRRRVRATPIRAPLSDLPP
jgi:hypothetical protein